MLLVYEGDGAIKKIRDVLGPTDPLKAPGGTIRREFGSSVMINTAHASDSRESYEREKEIVKVNANPLGSIIKEYLAKK
jgi:nucleoside diphosphate kinase